MAGKLSGGSRSPFEMSTMIRASALELTDVEMRLELDTHEDSLATHKDTLAAYGITLDTQEDELADHKSTLDSYGTKLDSYSDHVASGNSDAHAISNITGLIDWKESSSSNIHPDNYDSPSGYTGTITVVTGVNFTDETISTVDLNVSDGMIK